MQVGAYADGRSLSFEPATGEYDIGGIPITLEQLRAYDAHAQIAWLPGYGLKPVAPVYVAQATAPQDSPLSSTEYGLFALAFLVVPYACVFLSSILYYVWRREHPRRAAQINRLGFMIFGTQLLLSCAFIGISAALAG